MLDDAFAELLAEHVSLPGVTIAMSRLPQGSSYPGLVYVPFDDQAPQRLCAPSPGGSGRVQVVALAQHAADVIALHRTLRAQLERYGKRQTANYTVLNCVFDRYGPPDKDDDTGVCSKPADYLITYR